MPCARLRVASVEVAIRARLLDDEDVLAQLDDAVEHGRRQLGKGGDVNQGSGQAAVWGVTAAVQKAQRRAASGMSLRHSGQGRLTTAAGPARRSLNRV